MEWTEIKRSFEPGQRVEATIKKIDHYGIHSTVNPQVPGYTKRSECLLTRKVVNLAQEFRVNQTVPAEIIDFNPRYKSLELSFKRAMDNPWAEFLKSIEPGTFIDGEVVLLTESKAIVEVEPGVAGVLHKNDMWIQADHIDDIFMVEDRVHLQVIGISEKDELLILSARGLFQGEGNVEENQATFKIEEKLTDALQIFKWEQTRQTRRKYVLSRAFRSRFDELFVVDTDDVVAQPLIHMLNGLGIQTRFVPVDELSSINNNTDSRMCIVSCARQEKQVLPLVVQQIWPGMPQLVYGTHEQFEVYGDTFAELNAPTHYLTIPHAPEELIHALNATAEDVQAEQPPQPQITVEEPPTIEEEGEAQPINIQSLLDDIKNLTQASFAIIFQLNLNSMETEVFASSGKTVQLNKFDRGHLQFSPISDVIVDGDFVFEERGGFHFKYMKTLGHFESLVGVKIQFSNEFGYGLFLFGKNPQQFSDIDSRLFHFCEMGARSFIERSMFIERTTAEQKFIIAGKLTANFMHEIKNQMQALEYWLEILKNDSIQLNVGNLSGEDKLFLSRFEQAVDGAQYTQQRTRHVEELFLNLLRGEEKTKINIEKYLNTFVDTLLPVARRKKIRVHVEAPKRFEVSTSVSSLNQILINLFLNSIDFMPLVRRQTGRIEIIATRQANNTFPVCIEFYDNGPGINERHREKVFETLYTTKVNGSGLGLAISRRLAHELGGRLTIKETQRLSGTTFLLELPL